MQSQSKERSMQLPARCSDKPIRQQKIIRQSYGELSASLTLDTLQLPRQFRSKTAMKIMSVSLLSEYHYDLSLSRRNHISYGRSMRQCFQLKRAQFIGIHTKDGLPKRFNWERACRRGRRSPLDNRSQLSKQSDSSCEH